MCNAGEAVYVDDIPSPQGCLFGAFVSSSKAFAKVKYVDSSLALASPGAVAFISALDIPKGGANRGPVPCGGSENLFATDLVEYAGHPLGIMVCWLHLLCFWLFPRGQQTVSFK